MKENQDTINHKSEIADVQKIENLRKQIDTALSDKIKELLIMQEKRNGKKHLTIEISYQEKTYEIELKNGHNLFMRRNSIDSHRDVRIKTSKML